MKKDDCVTRVSATGKKFSTLVEGKEVARAYLYILSNDLHKEPFGLLEDVFVEEDYRGTGLGKEIVMLVIVFAKQAGCYKLIATSRDEREKVHTLYRNMGFSDYGKEFRMNFAP